MATSYANLGGTGDRRRMIIVTAATLSFAGTPDYFVDGDTTSNSLMFWSGSLSSSDTLTFSFGDSSYVIDEAKFYQQTADSHGTWQWRGSNDGASWTNIGSTFTLGGSGTQTITALSGNTTDYKQYQIQGVSGSASGSPWLYEFEFKISPIVSRTNGSATAYANTFGSGNRTASGLSITATGNLVSSTGTDTGALQTLIDGTRLGQASESFNNPQANGATLRFDFGVAKLVDEVCLWLDQGSTGTNTYKWQGSNDASSWTDIATGITIHAYSGGGGSVTSHVQTFRELNGNTTAYRYLRLLVTTSNATSAGNISEFEFRISDPLSVGGILIHPGMDAIQHRISFGGGING